MTYNNSQLGLELQDLMSSHAHLFQKNSLYKTHMVIPQTYRFQLKTHKNI